MFVPFRGRVGPGGGRPARNVGALQPAVSAFPSCWDPETIPTCKSISRKSGGEAVHELFPLLSVVRPSTRSGAPGVVRLATAWACWAA
jgi:hypothetical protein